MAPTSTNTDSTLGLALAGRTESVNVLKPRDDFWAGKESFTAVVARSLPMKKSTAGLPTPPNSISPCLPPQAYKGRASVGPLTPPAPTHVDSDIDLEDAVEHAKAQDSSQHGLTARGLSSLADLDSVGAITPGLLAKHHLPGILLENGPLAIRHVMSYLTTSVPGFSGILPAKARRLVVGALEGRASDGSQGGIKGDVLFEKVGWGRWDARIRGQPPREARNIQQLESSVPQGSIRIPISSIRQDRIRGLASSHKSDPEYDTPMEDTGMLEHEADNMSLDGIESYMSYDVPDEKPTMDFEFDDVTDEEDWASIGAAALRQGSYPLSGGLMPRNQRYPPHVDPRSRSRSRSRGRGRGIIGKPHIAAAKSMPVTNSIMYDKKAQQQRQAARTLMGFPPMPEDSDPRDREAVAALLKLSSV